MDFGTSGSFKPLHLMATSACQLSKRATASQMVNAHLKGRVVRWLTHDIRSRARGRWFGSRAHTCSRQTSSSGNSSTLTPVWFACSAVLSIFGFLIRCSLQCSLHHHLSRTCVLIHHFFVLSERHFALDVHNGLHSTRTQRSRVPHILTFSTHTSVTYRHI